MKRCIPPLFLMTTIALSGCGNNSDVAAEQQVDEFAARIGQSGNGAETAGSKPAAKVEAVKYETPEGAAPGPFESGTATDPASSNCSAPKVAPFYGRKADKLTQDAIMAAVAPHTNVRFAEAGFEVTADAASDRLNVMLDTSGVIRDARCG